MKCSFSKLLLDLEIKLLGCTSGYETSHRYKARINGAEEMFDDLVEMINDRDYKVKIFTPLTRNVMIL